MERPGDLRFGNFVWSHFSRPRFGGFDDRVAAAGAAGMDGIGLYVFEYERLRTEEGRSASDIRGVLDRHGVCLADVEVSRGWSATHGDDYESSKRIEALAYEMADEFGVRYLQAIGSYTGGFDHAAEAFAGLCDRAAEHGLLVGIEWLPYTNIADAARAQDLVRLTDRPNAGYCVDIWHHARGANDMAMITALEPDRVFSIQMNDGALDAGERRLQDRLPGESCAPRGRRVRLRRLHPRPVRHGCRRTDLTRGLFVGTLAGASRVRRTEPRPTGCGAFSRPPVCVPVSVPVSVMVSSAPEPVSLHGRRALVLGGSVFVGRHLVDGLVRRGADVAVLNRGRTHSELPDGVERLVADRTDAAQMSAALAGRRWDAVFDVSGFVMAAGGSDIEGLLDLLDGQVGAYVYTSSIMAYDQSWAGVFPWTEDQPTNPDGATSYGGFKALAEASILARRAATGFPGSVVRPAAIYGPDNNIYDMELPMFLRLLQHRPILVPHGGLVVGTYGHVDDLCDAMIAAAIDTGSGGRGLQRVHRFGRRESLHLRARRRGRRRARRRLRARRTARRDRRPRVTAGIQSPVRHAPPRRTRRRQGGPNARRASLRPAHRP